MRLICPYPCYRTHQNAAPKREKMTKAISLVFFDMDGVLLDTVSSWRYVHEFFGTTNDRSIMPYLRGEIDYLEFIRRDVSLWKKDERHIEKKTLQSIMNMIPFIPGAQECVSFLRTHRIHTAIVTAGIDLLAERVASDLGIEYVFANEVTVGADGRLTGEGVLHVELMQKDKNIKALAEKLHIPLSACVAVGNSCFDIPMFEVCGLGIAFNPEDPCVARSADLVIKDKDLHKLIPVLQSYIEQPIQQ
ncbi:MAG: HAD-IB family phosphatase [Candidatus Thermoplasmatota archaeon]|nr:HAD-IB family phosphatase [Candidatus Thermoplasmatota archaeon]